MSTEAERAQRAMNGSRRQRDQEAARRQGLTPPPDKGDRQRRRIQAEAASEQRRRDAMDRIRELAPWLPEDWVGTYAGFAMSLQHRMKRSPTIDEITTYLRSSRGYAKAIDDPVIGIKPTKEEAA